MTSTIITALVGLFCTLASSVVTFLFTRKKYNEEVITQKINNMNKAFDLTRKIYIETANAQNNKIAMQSDIIKQLQEENKKLQKEVYDLQIQVAKMLNTICYDTTCRLRKTGLDINNTINAK